MAFKSSSLLCLLALFCVSRILKEGELIHPKNILPLDFKST